MLRFRLGSDIDSLIITSQWQPGAGTSRKARIGAVCPLEGRSFWISGVLLVDVGIGVAAPRIDSVLPAYLTVCHAQLLTLVGYTGAGQYHDQHIHGIYVFLAIPTGGPPLVVIAQLQRRESA